MKTLSAWAAGTMILVGCATAAPVEGASTGSESALVGGATSYERPEIGFLDVSGAFCTGTLVAPNVVVTAAHCLQFSSLEVPAGYQRGSFRIDRGPGDTTFYGFGSYVSYGTGLGQNDIALVRLVRPVPASVATPATIADAYPSSGPMTIFGYGCNTRPGDGDKQAGDLQGTKQKVLIDIGSVRVGCPGDSGGPTAGPDGAVFRVSSEIFKSIIFGWGPSDVFGDLVAHRDQLLTQINTWQPQPTVEADDQDNAP